jgi:hypothetical protein
MKPDEAHEHHEHLEHTAHGHGEGHGNTNNKRIAILISILAAALAVVEAGGKAAQNDQITKNIEASDTWAFYQAKTIRSTILRTSSTLVEAVLPEGLPDDRATKATKTLKDWKDAADRYDSDPKSGEGRKELMDKARHLTEERDHAFMALHNFEYGAASLQLSIVLASASVITGMPVLTMAAGTVGLLGVTLGGLGWVKPDLLHTLLSGGHHGDSH